MLEVLIFQVSNSFESSSLHARQITFLSKALIYCLSI